MAEFGPINTERKLRNFGVLDLEWVPGEVLPMPASTVLEIEGIKAPLTLSLPTLKNRTVPLQLRLAGYYDQQPESEDGEEPVMVERYEVFKSIAELVDFMFVREHRGMWFFAHAGGLFDMEFVLDELLNQIKDSLAAKRQRSRTVYGPDGQKQEETITATGPEKDEPMWTVKAAFSGSSAIIIHVTKGKHTWHCVDSYWLFRDKLSKIGESIGIKKLDEEKRRTPEETRKYYAETPLSTLIPYNKVDCEILWKAVAGFEKEVITLGGQLQQTIASTAMNLFRRAYLKRTIHTSEILNQIAVKSYFASRVEVFERHVSDFLIYDINSSFPYSMTFPLPGDLIEMGTTIPDDDEDSCIYLADATVEVPEMAIPPLPFRTTEDSRVFFPTGRWRSWFTSTDLRLAFREGCTIHKIHECYRFEPFEDFGVYAREIYALRAAADNPFRKLLLKYLLNSLYGKAAESLMKQEMLINPSEEDLDRTQLQMLQPGIWLREKEVAIAHRHVVVSSIITALSRRHLFDYAKMCEDQRLPIYYCDSVTGERTVVLQSSSGEVVIEPVEQVWARYGKAVVSYRGDKETCVLGEGWKALAQDDQGNQGWFPLTKLIRHKTSKNVHLISSKRGQVRVTEDHSIMVKGARVKPQEFVADNLQFDTVRAPAFDVKDVVDLYDYVRDFGHTFKTDVCHGDEITHCFAAAADGQFVVFNQYRESPVRFKRFYRRDSEDFRRLLRVLAAFISEGSSSVRGITKDTRSMFSIAQKNETWLASLKDDLLALTEGLQLTGPTHDPGSVVFYLRSGTNFLSALFGTLGGMLGSCDRHLPSFIYALSKEDFRVFWDKLMEGDGSIDSSAHFHGERCEYTTISMKLAAGVSFLLNQQAISHSIHYDRKKHAYHLRTRPHGTERKRWTTHVEVEHVDGYVYDLEVAGAHTFVDGLGRVLLHNTDSIASKATLPTDSKKLGALKLEKKMDWAEFVAPKIYRGEGAELKADGSWKQVKLAKAKGFSLGKFDSPIEALGRIIDGEQVGVQTMVRMRELYRSATEEHAESAPYEKLVIKALTQRMLSKRFFYPDGHTRAWTTDEILSGDFQRQGFDFDEEFLRGLDTTTRAMLEAAV